METMTPFKLEQEAKAAWYAYVEENGLPENIPYNPDEVYKDEWKGWVEWLGWISNAYN